MQEPTGDARPRQKQECKMQENGKTSEYHRQQMQTRNRQVKAGKRETKTKTVIKSVAGAIMEEKSRNPTQGKYDEKRLRENKWEAKNVCKHRMKKGEDNQKTNTKTHATNRGAEDRPKGATRRRRSLARRPKGRHSHSPDEQAGAPAGSIVSKNGRASKG